MEIVLCITIWLNLSMILFPDKSSLYDTGVLCDHLYFTFDNIHFYNWTNQHTKEIQMLKSLGANSFMLCKDFLKLLSKALILPIMIFGICCILFSIYPITIVVSLSVYWIALILVSIICFLQIRKVPLNINSFSDQEWL